MKADTSAKKMRLFGACEDNERLIIKLIFNVQCTLNELVSVFFCCFFLLLQIFAISKMHLKWANCRSCAVLCCAQCVVSKVVVALKNKHFHKLRISIQVYTLFGNMKRVDFCHFIHSPWWLLVRLFTAWMFVYKQFCDTSREISCNSISCNKIKKIQIAQRFVYPS